MRWLLLASLVACTGHQVADGGNGAAPAPATATPAAAATHPGCAGARHRELDFWLGDWDVTLRVRKAADKDEWAVARGTNRISSVLGGCAVEERFTADGPGQRWAGRSLSRWVDSEKRWRQAWVDDTGSFILLGGGMQGNDMVLTGEPFERDGKRVQMRMVFTDIAASSMLWRWERTVDAGTTWTPQMIIEYRRAAR